MRIIAITLCLSVLGSECFAEGCMDYPLTDGINVEDVDGGTKIVSTSSSSVSFDDIDSVRDAKDEATMEAKAQIAKFLNEDILEDSSLNKVVNESKSTNSTGKGASREEMITRLKSLRNKASALLKGAVVIGDCYSKDSEVRVTVGIKPETISSARSIDASINDSIKREYNSTKRHTSGLQGVDEHSNSSRIDGF